MSKIEDAIRKLTPEQRSLLELRLKEKRTSLEAPGTPLSVRPDETVFPISSGQKRLLELERVTPGTSKYNLSIAIRLMGPLDASALERSVHTVLNRHDVLRSFFLFEKNTWTQSLNSFKDPVLPILNLAHLPATKRLQQAIEHVHQVAKQPFNLRTGPITRNGLIRLAANDHILHSTIHHIACDAWSFDIYLSEIAALYTSIINHDAVSIPTLTLTYADFAYWQKHWLESPEAKKQLSFWESVYSDSPEPLRVPTSKPPAAQPSSRGANVSLLLPQVLTEQLKGISLKEKITPFSLFMAAFCTLLYRYSQQEDQLICIPVAGRRHIKLEPLIGYFNNILVLRTNLSPEQDFVSFATSIGNHVLAASDNQEIPFDTVANLPSLQSLQLSRAFFTFQDGISHGFSLPGIEADHLELPSPGADFDISFFVEQYGDDILLRAEYKIDCFDEGVIHTFLENYVSTLHSIQQTPDLPIGELPSFDMPVHIEPQSTVNEEAEIEFTASSIQVLPESEKTDNSSSKDQHNEPEKKSEPINPPPAVAPADDLEEILTRIWERLLDKHPVGIHDNFFEAGGHSLMAVNMFSEIQKYIGNIELPLSVLIESPTISSLATRIRNKDVNDWSPLVVIQPGRRSVPLFCIHGAGGNVLLYRDLAIQLGPDQTVYGLQAQGMDGLRPILGRIGDMAQLYVKTILETYPQGPYLLLGYCMGGTLAFEIAQQLTKQGHQVAMVAMLETYNWFNSPKQSLFSRFRHIIQKLEFHLRNYLLLPSQERGLYISAKRAEMKRRRHVWKGHVDARVNPRKLIPKQAKGVNRRALAEVWRMNDHAAEQYKPSEYPGPIMHFLPMKEYKKHTYPGMDWHGLAREVDTHILTVYPAGMLIQPFVKELAQAIRAEIFKITQQVNHELLLKNANEHNGPYNLPQHTASV